MSLTRRKAVLTIAAMPPTALAAAGAAEAQQTEFPELVGLELRVVEPNVEFDPRLKPGRITLYVDVIGRIYDAHLG